MRHTEKNRAYLRPFCLWTEIKVEAFCASSYTIDSLEEEEFDFNWNGNE